MRQLKYHEKKLLKKVRAHSLAYVSIDQMPKVVSDDDMMRAFPPTIPHDRPTRNQLIQTNTQVDFLQWKSDANIREVKILRRYYIQDREDYVKCVLLHVCICVDGWGGGRRGGGDARTCMGKVGLRC